MKFSISLIYSLSQVPLSQGSEKETWYDLPSIPGHIPTSHAPADDQPFTQEVLQRSLVALLDCHNKVRPPATLSNRSEHIESRKVRNNALCRWEAIRNRSFTLGAFMAYVDAVRKVTRHMTSDALTMRLDRDKLLAAGMDETASLLSEYVENAGNIAAYVMDSLTRHVTYMHAMDDSLHRMYENCLGPFEEADIKADADKDHDAVPQSMDMTAEDIILICKTMLRSPVHDRDGRRTVELLHRLDSLLHSAALRFSRSGEDEILVYLREWGGVGAPEYELLLRSKAPEVLAYALPFI